MAEDHTEMHIRVDTGNSIFVALVFAAATKHPNWEAAFAKAQSLGWLN
jgi:hypothetical protein